MLRNTTERTESAVGAVSKRVWRPRTVSAMLALLLIVMYFGSVAWFGHNLAEDVRAGVRAIAPGELVRDREG